MAIIFFLLAVAAAGLGGYAVLVRLGLDDGEAWAGGRMAGLVLVALPAWWLAVAGVTAWRVVAAGLLVVAAVGGLFTVWQRRSAWRQLATTEAVFVACALVALLLRLVRPEIMGTEKPMDMGIIASLLRTPDFPPPDMWLAGETLPYYYWGALVWVTPIFVSAIPLEVAYNLVVVLVAGLVGVTAWMLGRRLEGSHRGGALAAFLAVFAGTPDGLRQVLAGTRLGSLDYWHSSRQVQDTITEFPLFTVWLGDLHPHYLTMPIACLACLVALRAGSRAVRPAAVAMLAVLFGVTWAGNPWAMPPTLGAVALLLLAADGTWHWPLGRSAWRWLAVVAVAVGGWLVTAPFHLGFHPPFKGVGLVHAWTEPVELLMYGGCLLVAAFGAAFALVRGWLGDGEPGRVGAVAVFAAATVLAAVSGRPTLVLLAVPLLVLTLATIARGEETDRAAIALAALGVFLFTVPEVVFVRDPYGEQLHRMNTVFKAYIQGWILLAVAVPVLLKRAARGVWVRRALVVVTVVPAVAHLAGMGAGLFSGKDLGIDGLRWMAEGDRAVVRALREQPQGAVLVEAVGGAYTEYARFSAASGVPAVLGWGNHESVWRGNTVTAEVEERKARVRELYSCGDPQGVRDVAAELGADLVAVGSLERADFDAEALKAVIAAGEVEVAEGEAVLVRFTGRVESPARGAEGE